MIAGLMALCLAWGAAPDDPKPVAERAPDVTSSPAREDFWIIPLRVHVLRSETLPEVNCDLADADIERILGKVNRIWSVAGVHFGLESIVREPAEQEDRFRVARELNGKNGPAPHPLFRVLRPEGSRQLEGLHVYYIHDFDVNGVYLGQDFAFVRETAKLRPVEGGIDEPLPRVTAHELGHALGLPHRQDRTNLLASGTTGTLLNAAEVERVRSRIARIPGARTLADLVAAAEKEGDTDLARRYRRWLDAIPPMPLPRPDAAAGSDPAPAPGGPRCADTPSP